MDTLTGLGVFQEPPIKDCSERIECNERKTRRYNYEG